MEWKSFPRGIPSPEPYRRQAGVEVKVGPGETRIHEVRVASNMRRAEHLGPDGSW